MLRAPRECTDWGACAPTLGVSLQELLPELEGLRDRLGDAEVADDACPKDGEALVLDSGVADEFRKAWGLGYKAEAAQTVGYLRYRFGVSKALAEAVVQDTSIKVYEWGLTRKDPSILKGTGAWRCIAKRALGARRRRQQTADEGANRLRDDGKYKRFFRRHDLILLHDTSREVQRTCRTKRDRELLDVIIGKNSANALAREWCATEKSVGENVSRLRGRLRKRLEAVDAEAAILN